MRQDVHLCPSSTSWIEADSWLILQAVLQRHGHTAFKVPWDQELWVSLLEQTSIILALMRQPLRSLPEGANLGAASLKPLESANPKILLCKQLCRRDADAGFA
jgi:hypothetical protein